MKSDDVKSNVKISGKISHILKTVSLWHFVWISICLAEIFTAIMSIILRGRITVDYLITGGVVSLIVASIVVYLIRHFRVMEETLTQKVLKGEDEYRELADLLPETVFEVDLEGNITFTNRHGLRSFGYTLEDLAEGLNVFQMFIPEDIERAKQNIQRRLRGEEFEDHEYTAMRKDGSTFSVLVSSSPIVHDGTVVGLRGIVFDISERKKVEEELHMTNECFRMVLKAPIALFTQDQDLRFTWVYNPTPGFDADALIGKTDAELVPSDQAAAPIALKRQVLETGKAARQEISLLTEGKTNWYDLHVEPYRNTSGNVVGISCISIDITERKKAEMALKQSEEKFRKILASSPDSILVVDLNGIIVECNNAALRLFECSMNDEMRGRKVLDFVSKNDVGIAKENFKKTLEQGSMKDVEITALSKGGREFPLEISVSVISDVSGKPTGVVAMMKDITERKRTEEDMRRRLMKFDLHEGNLYLVQEATPLLSVEAFSDLLKAGYKGYVFSRMSEEFFKGRLETDYDFIWLADTDVKGALSTDLDNVLERVEDLPPKVVLLLDSFDHLVFKNGFKKALSFVHTLREKAYLKRLIVVFAVDPDTLEGKELSLLRKDTLEVEPLYRKDLPEDMLEILGFIYGRNSRGIKPSYADIRRDLGISKPTVLKRMRYLNSAGYVLESMSGNRKSVKLSEKGRSLFLK